jgi:DNA polymerase-1|tara:strand:- start:2892 stop:3944 length:1053 start_codon:yes stop_codon:yes gene_type:complete
MNTYQRLFKELQKEKETSPKDANDHIMVFDGLNTFIRSFGATPAYNEDGDHIGGITGFLYSVGKTVRDFNPSRCVIAFDGRNGNTKRKKIYKDYKANRANKTKLRRFDHHDSSIENEQESMKHQFSRLISYLDYLPVTFLSMDGIEADDTIAYIAQMYTETCKKITIVSTDRDFYQLVDDRIQIWSPIKKKMYDTQAVIDEFGVHPNNMVLYRSFTGDKSDNIPGVSGIGPKTILKLIPEIANSKQVTLEELFEKSNTLLTETKKYQKILDHRETLEKNWQLMDIKLLDISANVSSKIRGIMGESISGLNRAEFQRLFYEDKMWAVMKNLPDWLTRTWLSLDAFAKQTQK